MLPQDHHVNSRGYAPQPSSFPGATNSTLPTAPARFKSRASFHAPVPGPPMKTWRDKQLNRTESDISNLDLAEPHYGRSGGAVKSAASTALSKHTHPHPAESYVNPPLGGAVRSTAPFVPLTTDRSAYGPETAMHKPRRHRHGTDVYEPSRRPSSPRLDDARGRLEQQSVSTTREGPPTNRDVPDMTLRGEYKSRGGDQDSSARTCVPTQSAADRTIERFQTQIETLEVKIDNLLPALAFLTETVEGLSSNVEMLSGTKNIGHSNGGSSGSSLSPSSRPFARRATAANATPRVWPGVWSPGKLTFENPVPEHEVDEIIYRYEHQPRERQQSTWETDSDSDGSDGIVVSTHASRRASRLSSLKSSAACDPFTTPAMPKSTEQSSLGGKWHNYSKGALGPMQVLIPSLDILDEIDSHVPSASNTPQNVNTFPQDISPKSHGPQRQQDDHQPQINPNTSDAAWYFFYGTLKDPKLLRAVLDPSQPPRLTPAWINGYAVKYFGVYPAAVPGTCARPAVGLEGVACFVATAEALVRLREHADKHYTETVVELKLEDGAGVQGKMFVWSGEEKLLTNNPAI